MKKLSLLICLAILSNITSAKFKKYWNGVRNEYFSQESPRVFWGGSLFAQPLDSNGYVASIAPSVAWRAGLRSVFVVSAGVNYKNEKLDIYILPLQSYRPYTLNELQYSGNVAWRYFYYWRFFSQFSVSLYNVKNSSYFEYLPADDKVVEHHTRQNIFAAPIGLGYVQPFQNGNSSLVLTCLYDVIQNDFSPYRGKPFFRAGFNFGL